MLHARVVELFMASTLEGYVPPVCLGFYVGWGASFLRGDPGSRASPNVLRGTLLARSVYVINWSSTSAPLGHIKIFIFI